MLRMSGATPLLPLYVFVAWRRTTSHFLLSEVRGVHVHYEASWHMRKGFWLVFVRCPVRISNGTPFTLGGVFPAILLIPPSNFLQSRCFKLGSHLSLSHLFQLHFYRHPLTEGYWLINPIIPPRNTGLPQEFSISLYSWHRFWFPPRYFWPLWPLQAPFFDMYSSVSLYFACLGGSTLGFVWLSSDGFRSVRPSYPHLRFLICKFILSCFVRFHSLLFVIWSGQKIPNIFLWHLLMKTCSLAVTLFEFFQDSQP